MVAKAGEGKVLVQSPMATRPTLMTRGELLALWDGGLILMTRRAGLSDITRRFDISWFLGAIHKYRHLLTEVLVASFFLQLFALVSPLFFQVAIDKVLVHRGLSTLDVLVIGLFAISIFETVLGILRTYLFAHTTNRIDVELGARLFNHLLALPLAYFQARRVGDSVARVRELENIRNFLTSSALTLVIDLFFTFVFLAVMPAMSSPASTQRTCGCRSKARKPSLRRPARISTRPPRTSSVMRRSRRVAMHRSPTSIARPPQRARRKAGSHAPSARSIWRAISSTMPSSRQARMASSRRRSPNRGKWLQSVSRW